MGYGTIKEKHKKRQDPVSWQKLSYLGKYLEPLTHFFIIIFLLAFSLAAQSSAPALTPTPAPTKPPVSIKSIYGVVPIDAPIFQELFEDPVFLRLKKIDVMGPSHYFRNLPPYPMFEHALGVYALLKRFNIPFTEQIAGVLEYTSHSVFGDFGSFLFDTRGKDIFNVDTESDFIKKTDLLNILAKYNLTPQDVYPLNPAFKAISALPPELSAGSIEKNLRLALSFNLIDRDSITKIIDNLRYDQGRWYFVDPESAHKLGMISLYFDEKLWGSPVTFAINRWFGTAIKRASDLGLVNLNALRFGTDEMVLKDLFAIQDPVILNFMYKARQPYRFFRVIEQANSQYDYLLKPKFTGLDPFVKVGTDFKRLSEIDPIFKKEFDRVKGEFEMGIRIKYRDQEYAQPSAM